MTSTTAVESLVATTWDVSTTAISAIPPIAVLENPISNAHSARTSQPHRGRLVQSVASSFTRYR